MNVLINHITHVRIWLHSICKICFPNLAKLSVLLCIQLRRRKFNIEIKKLEIMVHCGIVWPAQRPSYMSGTRRTTSTVMRESVFVWKYDERCRDLEYLGNNDHKDKGLVVRITVLLFLNAVQAAGAVTKYR